MLITDFTLKLFDLQQVSFDNIKEDNKNFFIFVTSNKDIPVCKCGVKCHIHDYRVQKIKAGKFKGKNLFIFLKKRRFKCPIHRKIFTESFNFIPKRHRIHSNICPQVIDKLHSSSSMSSVAREFNISTHTVIRYFDLVSYPTIENAPNTLAIDEFKGNSGGFKYNAIITNPKTHEVLDILQNRELEYLKNYFSNIKNRENVKFFIQDMWEPFKNAVISRFKNVNIVADKYHYIRQIYWALEKVRKNEQKRLRKEERLFFKRSKYLLTKQSKKLKVEEKQYLYNMFSHSNNLEQAYRLKEAFKDFIEENDYEKAKKELNIWIEMARESELKEFKEVITALTNWKKEILNSKLINETNGYTEGCNNKIKVLKRNAYGYRNFKRFRNRILHMFNKKEPHLATSC